jgi:4-amino-4-deoxy-L-arabinose transferase-like glycosyltransferase
MTDFYQARVREPMFVYATRLGLRLADDNEIGVGIASAAFSTLTVGAIYLLGAFAFGRPAGLLAALAFAVERRVIGLSIEGWRDDAFACFVTLFAYAALRLYSRSSFSNAVLLGLAAGGAWLTRITSLTFLVPSFVALAVFPRARPRGERLRRLALAVSICVLLMAPFIANCAIVYGDPLYAINEYVGFFRERAGHVDEQPLSVFEYVASFRSYELLDKLLIGYTAHPFAPKWNFEDWHPALGPVLAAASLVGLFLFLGLPRGRLLLLIHLGAMFPFSFSWDVPGGSPWRHSLHAYPFYLVAAGFAICAALRLVASASARAGLRARLDRRRLLALGAAVAVIVVATPTLSYGLRYMRVREAIRHRDDSVLVLAGPRDALFFGAGWHPPVHVWNWYARFMRAREGTLYLPLQGGRGYRLVLRMDPFAHQPQRPQQVEVLLNGAPLARIRAAALQERTGRHEILVPASRVRDGRNRLVLRADHLAPATALEDRPAAIPEEWEAALELRYIRVEPLDTGRDVEVGSP